jgi:hypothetical protein
MSTLVIVTHEFDRFGSPSDSAGDYLLFDVLKQVEGFGHRWVVSNGPNPLPGDAAFLHVDCTYVDDEYLALATHYPRTINFGTGDISKRTVSRLQVAEKDDWAGKVMIKPNLNCGGLSEKMHNHRAQRAGHVQPHPPVPDKLPYCVVGSIRNVTPEEWANPDLVVERFLPEEDEQGYAVRTWVFMGARERCTRTVTPRWFVKASEAISYAPVEVPSELRRERERLGFDYGKFDFVMHDGTPHLLDANRTPGAAPALAPLVKAGAQNLAEGLDELLRAST